MGLKLITEEWVCTGEHDGGYGWVYFTAQGNEKSVEKSVAIFKHQHKGYGHELLIKSRKVDERRTDTG